MNEFVEVATTSGVVRGTWEPTTGERGHPRFAAFRGIPFAEPPVGNLRFAAPVPARPWEGVRDALTFGPTAQRGDPGITLIPEPSIPGESTLNVNVYTPSPVPPPGTPAAGEKGLPVLVWIHGGGFISGSPASPWYEGRNFNRDGVVTVTISYRLGFDGFGWIPDAPANRGVLDWLLALEWVQHNIVNFGGDPGRVTIAGQSAGGGAVLTLLGMDAAQHLFHSAISVSGALADLPLARAEALGTRIAKRLGVPANRKALAAVPEDDFLEAQRKATRIGPTNFRSLLGTGLSFGPVVDGELIIRPTLDSLRTGVGRDKPLLIGTTDDEFTMAFTDAGKHIRLVPLPLLLSQLGVPKSARDDYLADNADVAALGKARLAGRILTDRMFRTVVPRVIAARQDAPGWAYRFSWPSGVFGYAEHCLDVPFFFDCLDGPAMEPLAGPNPPQHLADEIHSRAVRFITDGDPGWPRYEASLRIARVYDVEPHDQPDAYRSVASLLNP